MKSKLTAEFNEAFILSELGRAKKILASNNISQALEIAISLLDKSPLNLLILNFLYEVYFESGELSQAIEILFKKADIALSNNNFLSLTEICAKILSLRTSDFGAIAKYAQELKNIKKWQEAINIYEVIRNFLPNNAAVYFHQAMCFENLNKVDEAVEKYEMALQLNPNFLDAWSNRGNVLRRKYCYQDALDSYKKALAIDNSFSTARFNLAQLQLLLGDFEQGLLNYEVRNEIDTISNRRPNLTIPLWEGGVTIQNKLILIVAEQGYGDMIQFVRYVFKMVEEGAKVILAIPHNVARLFAGIPGVEKIILPGEPLIMCDYYCAFMSLPFIYKTTLETIYAPIPYLFSDASLVEVWKKRLGEKKKLRIGLAWSGNLRDPEDNERSIPIQYFDWLKELNCEIISLQKEIKPEDQEKIIGRQDVLFLGDEIQDFADTAALIELVDIVISVDTAVAHLAGAMGKKTIVLLSTLADWRWLLDRSDTPWYNTITLIRQKNQGDWQELMIRLQNELNKLL